MLALDIWVSIMDPRSVTESKKLGQVTQFLPEIYKLLELLNTTSDIGTVNKTVSLLHCEEGQGLL